MRHSHRKQRQGWLSVLMEHRTRFATFSVIGAAIFVMGLAMQAALTGEWHMNADLSFVLQGIVSVQASFIANYYWTWRDQDAAFWPACGKFNAQKVVASVANLIVYAVFVKAGLNYLVANVADTAVFTVVNYVTSHLWVFTPKATTVEASPALVARLDGEPQPWWPTVSVVVPCRDSSATIRATVDALLGQEYPHLEEVILVGSTGDKTWIALADVTDPRLVLLEQEPVSGLRDPAVKRDKGVRKASGEVIALADSDIVMGPDWLRRAVGALIAQGGGVVAGGMRSIHDTFWGRFVDQNRLGAKTPRLTVPYMVTARNFGRHNRKPPITANVILTRDVYEDQPIDGTWMYGYEDYEWFWRVAKAGHRILFTDALTGRHHHRRSFRHLVTEYRRAAQGCARFIRTHPDCPLARKRRQQAFLLPLIGLTGLAAAGVASFQGQALPVAVAALAGLVYLMAREFASSRTAESLAYPFAGGMLGVVFTASVAQGLLSSHGPKRDYGPAWEATAKKPSRGICWPLVALLALQAGLSLGLVWSNTAFGDEALYLWAGHLELAHWLHGFPLPTGNGYYSGFNRIFSGAPMIYPPLAAVADSLGGLAGARVLSLLFMLAATVLLYLTARRLFEARVALIAVAVWVASEPVLRLAFATYDAMSVFLVALAAWIALEAAYRRRRGELVLLAALTLAVGNLVAYSSAVADPVVIAFALAAYVRVLGKRQAFSCAAWLLGALALFVGLFPTALHLWPGIVRTTLGRTAGHNGYLLVARDAWAWTGLAVALAILGVIIAILAGQERRTVAVLAVFAVAGLAVPLGQLRLETVTGLDKHAALGLWFAVIGAGYGVHKLVTFPFPSARPVAVLLFCSTILLVPCISGWSAAYAQFHNWPRSAPFVKAFQSVAADNPGRMVAEGTVGPAGGNRQLVEYYTHLGHDWWRWSDLSLDPEFVARSQWRRYYASQLRQDHIGTIALFYTLDVTSGSFKTTLFVGKPRTIRQALLQVAVSPQVPGLFPLTQAIESDHRYKVARTGSYGPSIFYVIWRAA